MTVPVSLDGVVRGGLCIGCGLLWGSLVVRAWNSRRGDLQPVVPDATDAALVETCPGVTIVGPDSAVN